MEEKEEIKVSVRDSEQDESRWVALAKSGDKAAFGRLVTKYQKKVLRVVVAMVGSLDAAMDIVQEAFVRAYQALDRFDAKYPFYPWLSRIAGNLAINYIKKNQREMPLDDEADEKMAGNPSPLDNLQMAETDRRFLTAVNELPAVYRTVFVMRNLEELSYEEIAFRLGISVGTVDSRLYRARRMLVEKLKDLLD